MDSELDKRVSFLPSFAVLKAVTVRLTSRGTLALDGQTSLILSPVFAGEMDTGKWYKPTDTHVSAFCFGRDTQLSFTDGEVWTQGCPQQPSLWPQSRQPVSR